jgi:Hemolysins and related proteins containing CBS domains
MSLPPFQSLAAALPEAADGAGLPLLAVMALLLLNGFFVAAEFAMVKLRAGGGDEEDDFGGRRNGARVRKMLQNTQPYLSAAQLGITLTSLGLGWVGAPFVARLLEPWLRWAGIGNETAVAVIAFVVVFSLLSFLHVVLGEQVPKLLAIRRAREIMLWTAGPMRLFHFMLRPLVRVVDFVSGWILRTVLRTPPDPRLPGEDTEDELRSLLRNTAEGNGGTVSTLGREILINALDLRKRVVRDIMTPRGEVVFLDLEESFDDNIGTALESRHTRFPLCRGRFDESTGLVHIKDLLALVQADRSDLASIQRDLLHVPELMPLERLLKLFLGKGAHLAVVVDEYGGAVGVVTLDNVLAELVGEIQDEFDTDEEEYRKVGEDEFVLEGGVALHDLGEMIGVEVESTEVSTIGGYLTHELGHLPKKGETVRIDGYEFTVSQTDGRRVVSVHAKRCPQSVEAGESVL